MIIEPNHQSGTADTEASFSCPTCGSRLPNAALLRAGVFSYSKTNGFRIGSRLMPGGSQLGDLMGAIMQARGAICSATDLAMILQSSAGNSRDLVKSQLWRAKQEVRNLGAEWPIGTQRARGWYWTHPEIESI